MAGGQIAAVDSCPAGGGRLRPPPATGDDEKAADWSCPSEPAGSAAPVPETGRTANRPREITDACPDPGHHRPLVGEPRAIHGEARVPVRLELQSVYRITSAPSEPPTLSTGRGWSAGALHHGICQTRRAATLHHSIVGADGDDPGPRLRPFHASPTAISTRLPTT